MDLMKLKQLLKDAKHEGVEKPNLQAYELVQFIQKRLQNEELPVADRKR